MSGISNSGDYAYNSVICGYLFFELHVFNVRNKLLGSPNYLSFQKCCVFAFSLPASSAGKCPRVV